MRPIERWLLLGTCLALPCWGCGDEKPRPRRAAPNDGVLPTAGKAGKPSVGDAGTGNSGNGPDGFAGAGAAESLGRGGEGTSSGSPPEDFRVGVELRVTVARDASTFVNLAAAKVVDIGEAEPRQSSDWDLAFRGWDIFTNGGASGGGKGAAFGPLPFTYLLAAVEPRDVPFLIEDKAAGAFRDWYFYDGQWHSLYSRFHAYGVKSGERLFKLQLLGYYGDVQGAPISGLFRLRYAEVTPESDGKIVEISKLDATAGGLGGDDQAASGSLTLGTGEQQQLTPSQAAESSLWDLSFRRDSVSVNGGLGGPGQVTAVDLDAAATESETLEEIKTRTAENQASGFAALDYDALTLPNHKYRGDRIVSALTEAWADSSSDPPQLVFDASWLVAGADGKSRFLVGFTGLKNSTTESPGSVVMRIVKVR
jgi:hypothetical protein